MADDVPEIAENEKVDPYATELPYRIEVETTIHDEIRMVTLKTEMWPYPAMSFTVDLETAQPLDLPENIDHRHYLAHVLVRCRQGYREAHDMLPGGVATLHQRGLLSDVADYHFVDFDFPIEQPD